MSKAINLTDIINNIYSSAQGSWVVVWRILMQPVVFQSLIAVLIIGFGYYLYREYRKWNKGWLTNLIEEGINASVKKSKTLSKKNFHFSLSWKTFGMFLGSAKLFLLEVIGEVRIYFKEKVGYQIRRPYLPSITWLLIFIILFAGFFILSHREVPYSNILSFKNWISFFGNRVINANELPLVISVLAGFISMVFALVIFITESIRDSKDPEQKGVLLRASGLWFLITLITFSLLNFLWFKITILSLLLPIFIAIGIIYSFWKVIYILIDKGVWEENKVAVIKDRIKKIVLDSVRERIGNNILLGKIGLDKDIKIEYTLSKGWLDSSASDYIFIESLEDGWLSDINLVELAKLATKLEDSARELGFSLYLEKVPSLESAKAGESVKQSKAKKENIKKVYLLKRYGEHLPPSSIFTEDSKVILALPKEFDKDPDTLSYVRNLVPHIFKFKKTEPSSDAFRRELQGTKDQLVSAIKSVSLGAIEELKQTYLHLAETFLEITHQFGGGFSAEQAKKERGNFFEGWNEIRWLSQDIRELITVAGTIDNRNVISDIGFLPIAIAIRAVQAKDHFLFQEFVGYSSFLYYLTKDKANKDIKAFMIERSWKWLQELSDYYIEPKLKDRENNNDAGDVKEYEDFALYLFKVFQTLIKATFDREDINAFKKILHEFSRLYRHFDPENDYPNVESLERSLEVAQSPEGKINIQKLLDSKRVKEEASKKVKLAKDQIFLGLAAKIFNKYEKEYPAKPLLKDFFDTIYDYLPKDVAHLTKVFDSARDFGVEDSWGWDDWETIADGEVHVIDFHGKLDRLYCVVALNILKSQTPDQIKKIKILPSRSLAYLSEERAGANNLTVILDSIESKPEDWKFVLDATASSKVGELKGILKTAREQQEENEKNDLKKAKINPDNLKEFKEAIKDSFYQSGYIRSILKYYEAYRDLTVETPGKKVPSWGYNQIDEKAAFVKDWHVHYGGWGENYGRGMANSEDQILFEKMTSGAGVKKTVDKQDIIPEMEKVLNEAKFENPVIIQTLDRLYEYDHVRRSESFIPRYHKDCPKTKLDDVPGFMGVLNFFGQQVPIMDIFIGKSEFKNKVIITDLSKFGALEQYSPLDSPEDNSYLYDIFFIRVTDLNEDNKERQKIIDQKAPWLKEYEDQEGYLRQKALINLYQKFEFKIIDAKKAYCITVNKTSAGGA